MSPGARKDRSGTHEAGPPEQTFPDSPTRGAGARVSGTGNVTAAVGIDRLPFIDGVRGMAAAVVTLGHAVFVVDGLRSQSTFLDATTEQRLAWVVRPGAQMVYLFLMVSAFSLVYSEDLRRQAGRRATSASTFLRRRAWRILPTYYLALAAGLAATAATTPSAVPEQFDHLQPSTAGTLAHLALIHNARLEWHHQINSPLWSLAYEVQLYVLFPLLYLAVRRGLIMPVVVLGAVFVGVDVLQVLPNNAILGYWFILGGIVAGAYRQVPPTWVPVLLPVGLVALPLAWLGFPFADSPAPQTLTWSVAFVCLLTWMGRRPTSRRNPCNLPSMRWLGVRSYSLYAMHYPLLWLLYVATTRAGFTSGGTMAVAVLVGFPASLLVAHLTYQFVERPSLDRGRRAAPRVVVPAQRPGGGTYPELPEPGR